MGARSHLVSGARCGQASSTPSLTTPVQLLASVFSTQPASSGHLTAFFLCSLRRPLIDAAWCVEMLHHLFFACADWQLRSSGDCFLHVSMSAAMSAASSRSVAWCIKCGATHFESDVAQLKSG